MGTSLIIAWSRPSVLASRGGVVMFATWNPERGEPAIVRIEDSAFISLSDDNRDYRAYLAWVAEGNTAEEWNPE